MKKLSSSSLWTYLIMGILASAIHLLCKYALKLADNVSFWSTLVSVIIIYSLCTERKES